MSNHARVSTSRRLLEDERAANRKPVRSGTTGTGSIDWLGEPRAPLTLNSPGRDRKLGFVRLCILDAVAAALTLLTIGSFASDPLMTSGLSEPLILSGLTPLALGVLSSFGLYRRPERFPGAGAGQFVRLLISAAIVAWVGTVLVDLFWGSASTKEFAYVSLVLPVLWSLNRWVHWRLADSSPERVIVIGTGVIGRRVVSAIRRAEPNMQVVGFVEDASSLNLFAGNDPILGGINELGALLEKHDVDKVVVAFTPRRDHELMPVLRSCDAHGIDIEIVPRLFDFIGLSPRMTMLGDLPAIEVAGQRVSTSARFLKRTFDLIVAGTLFALMTPLFAVTALAVFVETGFPILYRQERIGRFGRPFQMLKFRSMIAGAESADRGHLQKLESGDISLADASSLLKQKDDPRITSVGRIIRRTSLDELPQIWNVLRGDMSLVGPRPLREYEVDRLETWQMVRQDVKPGITGLWQVLGRSEIEWEDRMQLDYSYVRHWSPVADLQILARTFTAVLAREGAH